MTMSTTFKYSEAALKRARRRMLTMQAILPLFIIAYSFLNPLYAQASVNTKLGVAVLCIVLIEAVMLATTSILLRKLKQITVTLTSEAVERAGGRLVEKVLYEDIRQVRIREYPSGEVACIRVKSAASRSLLLNGCEHMESIAEQIEISAPADAVVSRKRQAVDFDNPLFLGGGLLAGGLLTTLFQLGGENVYAAFNCVFWIAFGLVCIFYKPVSRAAGKRFETYELIMGGLLLVGGVVSAGMMLKDQVWNGPAGGSNVRSSSATRQLTRAEQAELAQLIHQAFGNLSTEEQHEATLIYARLKQKQPVTKEETLRFNVLFQQGVAKMTPARQERLGAFFSKLKFAKP